jgi:acyl-CoA-binding protein
MNINEIKSLNNRFLKIDGLKITLSLVSEYKALLSREFSSLLDWETNATDSDKRIKAEFDLARKVFGSYKQPVETDDDDEQPLISAILIREKAFEMTGNRDVFGMEREPSSSDVIANQKWHARAKLKNKALYEARMLLNK